MQDLYLTFNFDTRSLQKKNISVLINFNEGGGGSYT